MTAGGSDTAGETPAWQLHRIFLHPEEIRRGGVVLSPSNTRHVRDVLRLRHGDGLRGLAPGGEDLILKIADNYGGGRLRCEVAGSLPPLAPSPLAVSVCQAMARGEKMEYVLQKGTELGAAEFWPIITDRTVVRPDSGRAAGRLARWRRIVEEAALQSGRSEVPVVHDVRPLAGLLADFREQPRDLLLVAYEEETRALRDVLREYSRPSPQGEDAAPGDGSGSRPRTAAVVIGPEGGFSPQEVGAMTGAGFIPVSLGPRILRSETAGAAALAILLYQFGDLGGPGAGR